MIPELLATGAIKTIKQTVVEGDTLLERAQNAMDLLRKGELSGEKLVWRISEQ